MGFWTWNDLSQPWYTQSSKNLNLYVITVLIYVTEFHWLSSQFLTQWWKIMLTGKDKHKYMGTKCLYSQISSFHTHAYPPHQQWAWHPAVLSCPVPASCTLSCITKYQNAVKDFGVRLMRFQWTVAKDRPLQLTHSNQFYLTPEDQKHHRRILPGVGAAAMLLPLPELLWGTSAHYSITHKTEEVLPVFSMLAWVTSKLHTHCLSSAK